MTAILTTVIPVFLIIFIGFAIGKKKKLNIQPVVDLIIYIASPCLLFASMARSEISLREFGLITLGTAAFIGIMLLASYIVFKFSSRRINGLYLPMVFGNSGFLAYPIALSWLGASGLSKAIAFDIINSLFLYSLGIYIISRKSGALEAFRVPLIYAVIAGILFNMLKINVPDAIFIPIQMIGAIAIPAALLVLGYKLSEIRLNHVTSAIFASLFKILFGFLAGIIVVYIFSIGGTDRSIILLQAAMPSAIMSMVLCQKYNSDCELSASTVFISTLISVITIPLIVGFA